MGVFDSALLLLRRTAVVWVAILTAWIWWSAMVEQPAWLRRLLIQVDHHQYPAPPGLLSRDLDHPQSAPVLLHHKDGKINDDHQHAYLVDPANYQTVRFTITGATEQSYREFVAEIRRRTENPGDERHGIRVMRDPSTVPDAQRFLLVEITNMAEDRVTFGVDVTTMYMVAYRVGQQAYFFNDAPAAATSNLFQDAQPVSLTFGSGYPSLRATADVSDIDLISMGIAELEGSISTLAHRSGTGDQTNVARSVIICIVLTSEAARLRYVEGLVIRSITQRESFVRNGAMLSLIRHWRDISEQIQQSNQGAFSTPLALQRRDYSQFTVSSVAPIISSIGIMMFVCNNPGPRRSSDNQLLRDMPVNAPEQNHRSSYCVHPEPTVRILGRNGLCMDVKGGQYTDGTVVQLWTCHSESPQNQLWTLKRDGTIRSNNKCLAVRGTIFADDHMVMIFTCNVPSPGATRWEVWDNGTILNPETSLALTAWTGNIGTTLSVDQNTYATTQGWLLSKDTGPTIASIVGLKNLCMQASGGNVWLEECRSNKPEQMWALYADGSIRPQQNQDVCLTCDDETSQGASLVNIRPCNWGSPGQRWMFKNYGTIMNLNTQMVMDVRRSDPTLHQIITYPPTGNPNQEWLLFL